MTGNYRTYIGRYYVLIAISLLAIQQNLAWVSFGPIAKEAKDYYGLSNAQITLLPAYSPICFVLLAVPFIWFLQRFGLKIVGIGSAWILALGCVIRIFIPSLPEASHWIWIMHIGHIMIGYAGLPVMILPPKVSSVWFPPKERVFATSVAVTAQGIGVFMGYIMNPYLTQQYSIHTMLYVQAELGVFVAVLFTIYFPPHPPTPPCTSAGEDRTDFGKSLKDLLVNCPFIILVLSGGIIMGGSFGFQSVLSIILNSSTGFNEKIVVSSLNDFLRSTSWLGAISAVLGTASGQITGMVANRFQRRFKLILILLLSLTTISLLWFSLSIYGWGSKNPVNLFITFCMYYISSFAAMPIYYEAAIESTYPIAEGTSGGLLTLSCNLATLLFAVIGLAGIFSDKHPERAKAMMWTMTGLSTISLILLFFYFGHYKRLNVDVNEVKNASKNLTRVPEEDCTSESSNLLVNS